MAPGYEEPTTDYTRWRMKADHGRQTWHYLTEEQAKEWKQSTADKYFLGLDTVSPQKRSLNRIGWHQVANRHTETT